MSTQEIARQWGNLRFAIIGELLASPPRRGELQQTLARLAAREWTSPTGEMRRFGVSTIERWYYTALRSTEPTEALRRRVRKDVGSERVMSQALLNELHAQYLAYPRWSYQLHSDNLGALVEEKPELGAAPSNTTVRRRMQRRGWRKRRVARTEGHKLAQERLENLETRSFEKAHGHALWHFDFHKADRTITLADGSLIQPWCLCVLDDFSRLCCHIQWYYQECTETLAHGLIQAFLKRGLPRVFLSDNGAAMTSAETRNGLADLSIQHETTLPYSPQQNGKQETFWDTLEQRAMAMLSGVKPLRLDFLNRATAAWAELDYNRSRHSELGMSPFERLQQGQSLARESPKWDRLHFHFTRTITRMQRRSDGTISVNAVRFEVPSRMRHLNRLTLRYAHWDLSQAYIVDPRHSTQILAIVYPQDKRRNADGRRRAVDPAEPATADKPSEPIPPLMRKLLADYGASGQPPAYIPHQPTQQEDNNA